MLKTQRVTLEIAYDSATCAGPESWNWGELLGCDYRLIAAEDCSWACPYCERRAAAEADGWPYNPEPDYWAPSGCRACDTHADYLADRAEARSERERGQ